MKRKFMSRDSIVPVDAFVRHMGFIDYGFEDTGIKEYAPIEFRVTSRKTGNTARYVLAQPVEIEGVSGLYWWAHTDKQFRANERVLLNDVEVNPVPVGRVRYDGSLIFSLS